MAVVLAYVDAVPGRLYPLVPTFQELVARGHRLAIRCGKAEAELLSGIGLDARSLAPEIESFEPDDWKARTASARFAPGSDNSVTEPPPRRRTSTKRSRPSSLTSC